MRALLLVLLLVVLVVLEVLVVLVVLVLPLVLPLTQPCLRLDASKAALRAHPRLRKASSVAELRAAAAVPHAFIVLSPG